MLIRFACVLLLLGISYSGNAQIPVNSKERNALENCAFMDSDAQRFNCYSDVLREIFVTELNDFYQETNLKPNEVVQTAISVSLSADGKFQLTSIDTKNSKIQSLIANKLASLEKVLPIHDEQGNAKSGSFDMILASHVDDDGNVVPGLPKQKVGGFDDLVEAVDFAVIEQVPIYPGCDGNTNIELKDCMSKKVQEHVLTNFNSDLANTLKLPAGIQRIYVKFMINRHGKVVDVVTRASHPVLGNEAKRVVNLLPIMEPGEQKGKSVGVTYSLPIVFMVEETAKEKRARLRRERQAKNKI